MPFVADRIHRVDAPRIRPTPRLRVAGFFLIVLCLAGARPVLERRIAITFDDLPAVSVVGATDEAWTEMTRKLVAAIRAAGVPAEGFVNESRLVSGGAPIESRVHLLEIWLDAGLQLGNHTFSHSDLHRVGAERFERDILDGEQILRPLILRRGRELRDFRHPYLHTGRDRATRDSVSRFLAARGYRVAPVTIDSSEWIFARAYAQALVRGDGGAASRVASEYVPYMIRKLEYFERQSRALFGREIPQILLLHANSLNADSFPDLAAAIAARGYRYIPWREAVSDAAYRSRDEYFGSSGISWLHRWALTSGKKPLPGEPAAPKFVLEEAGIERE